MWGAIASFAGMGAGVLGKEQAAESTLEGAQTKYRIEKQKRDYMERIFEEDFAKLQPFYDAGVAAGVQYGDAVTNKLDPTKSGAYQLKLGMISDDLADAPEYIREEAIGKLGAIEGEAQKGRLLDLQQIGLGKAGAAGRSELNLGNILKQSYGLGSMALAGGMQSAADQRQSMWNVAASEISGFPAYMKSRQTTNQPSYGLTQVGSEFNPSALRR